MANQVNNSSTVHSYDSVPVVEVDSESQKSTTSAYKRYAIYSPNEWLLESITSIVALGLVIALAIIFWSMNNKPLSNWNSRISLSTSISILTTAYAIALMHGVSTFIGQSKWLHFKNKPRKLADLETFDQASRSVVLLEQRDVVSPIAKTATFGYAYNYSREALFEGLAHPGDNYPQDAGMQSAVFQGLYGINTTEPFTCPGVCRWPGSYISLGFKAECKNVTQQTLQTATCHSSVAGRIRECNMTSPGGVRVGSRLSRGDYATVYYMNTSSLMGGLFEGFGLPDDFPEIARFAVLRSTPSSVYDLNNINITECSLYVTAYEYNDAKANGSDFSFASRKEVNFGVKNPWYRADVVDLKDSTIWKRVLTKETTWGGVRIPALGIDFTTLWTLGIFLPSASIVSEYVQGWYENPSLGLAAALMGEVDLNTRFDAMATAMTNYIRYGPNTQTAYGEIILSETFVSIRWGYFAVPIAIEALAIVFAIFNIFNNRRSRDVPLWKSSALAVLACQHNEQLELLQTTGKGINEIQAEAKTFQVQLQ